MLLVAGFFFTHPEFLRLLNTEAGLQSLAKDLEEGQKPLWNSDLERVSDWLNDRDPSLGDLIPCPIIDHFDLKHYNRRSGFLFVSSYQVVAQTEWNYDDLKKSSFEEDVEKAWEKLGVKVGSREKEEDIVAEWCTIAEPFRPNPYPGAA